MKRERHDLTPLAKANRIWLEARQPSLRYDATSRRISGTFKLDALWDPEDHKLTTNPWYQKSIHAIRIMDEYQILINLRYPTRWIKIRGKELSLPSRYPPVFEMGSRAQKIAVRHNVPLADLHIYPDGECCLGFKTVPPDRNAFHLEKFLEEDLTAWFYRLSYVERFGLRSAQWNLWEEYGHWTGPENYLTEVRMVGEAVTDENEQCPCNSGLTYGICHKPMVVQAMRDRLI